MQDGLKILTLKRTHKREDGIFGVLDIDGKPFAVCLENSKLHIPKGEYECFRSYYNAGKYETFEIPVPNRTHILFHKGNVDENSKGCLLVAESFGILNGKVAVISSKEGFGEFMDYLSGENKFKLVIDEYESSKMVA